MSLGTAVRIGRILASAAPTFVLAIDDGLISGPRGSLTDPRDLVRSAIDGGATSVLGYPGCLRHCASNLCGAGYVQNLTASTTLAHHTRKMLVSSVEDALRNGADGVAVHLNLSADSEPNMLANLGSVGEQCRHFGVPLVVIAYPRRDAAGRDDNYETLRSESPEEYTALVAHCARIAVELGADAVKVPWTGSSESMSEVVRAALGAAVLLAGGPPVEDEEAVSRARAAIRAGAAGVAYGRQTFLHSADEVPGFVQTVLAAMTDAAHTGSFAT